MAKRDDLGGGNSTTATETSSVKQAATSVLEDAKGQARTLASQAKEETTKVAGQARDQITQAVSQRKDEAADRLGHLAGALRDTAHQLQEKDADGFGQYAERAAEQVDRLSTYLRDHDLRGFVRDTETFARRHPDVFLGGTFLAGLALARFLKSSAPERGGDGRGFQQYSAGYRGSDFQRQQHTNWAPERRNPDDAFASGAGAGASTYNAPLGG